MATPSPTPVPTLASPRSSRPSAPCRVRRPKRRACLRALNALPADMAEGLDRGSRARAPVFPAPLPTPVAVYSDVTPLAAPNSIGQIATVTSPTNRGVPAAPGGWLPLLAQFPAVRSASISTPATSPSTSPRRTGRWSSPPQSGIVTWSGWKNNGGGDRAVAIDHGNGIVKPSTTTSAAPRLISWPAMSSPRARPSRPWAAPAPAPARTCITR